MNSAYEFHDSTLSAIKYEKGFCLIELKPAYLHRSIGIPGVTAGQGFWQDLRIRIGHPGLMPDLPPLPILLDDGAIWFPGVRHQNMFPVALRHDLNVTISLVPRLIGRALLLSGTSIEVEPLGDAMFSEEFPGIGHQP